MEIRARSWILEWMANVPTLLIFFSVDRGSNVQTMDLYAHSLQHLHNFPLVASLKHKQPKQARVAISQVWIWHIKMTTPSRTIMLAGLM